MKKMVMMMFVYDEGSKQRIMRTVATFPGITTITMGARDGKLTVIGECDMPRVHNKLKRRWRKADIVSLGPYDPNAESERARFEAYRQNHHHYSPIDHLSYVGDHTHYHGCTIS